MTAHLSNAVDPTSVECPTCDAWVGWACNGANYGYHAAGYHPAREKAAARAAASTKIDSVPRSEGNAMTNEVAKFDPSTYVDKVRDKIKQSLVDVIPDDQWNAMLRAEIETFFKTKTTSQYGEQREQPSEFRRIVMRVIEDETKRRIGDMLAGPEWSSYWDGTQQQAGKEIARIARENGAAILAKWLESAIGQVISSIRFQNP